VTERRTRSLKPRSVGGRCTCPRLPSMPFVITSKPMECSSRKVTAAIDLPTDVGMYSLRHTAREIMSDQEVGYDTLSKRMGHKKFSTTFENYNKKTWAKRDREAAVRIQVFFAGLAGTGTEG
jgi:integrase